MRGGRSLEREISLRSGHHVATALRQAGHVVTEVDVDAELTKALGEAEVVFIALHGRDGEDGTIQLACEAVGVPYSGSPPPTCGFCFDKGYAKGLLERGGIPTPTGFILSMHAVRSMGAGAALRHAARRLGYPLVVKPAAQGSALGLSIVEQEIDLTSAVMSAFNHGDRVLLERFVDGTEIAVAIAGPDLEALPPVEIRTLTGVFDFETRVSPGAMDLICPASISVAQSDAAKNVARQVAHLLGIRDFARVDIRIGADGPQVLDVKTCPGLTESSIVPMAVAQAGLRFDTFVDRIVAAAIARAPVARA